MEPQNDDTVRYDDEEWTYLTHPLNDNMCIIYQAIGPKLTDMRSKIIMKTEVILIKKYVTGE